MKFSNSRSNNKNRTFKRSNNHHRRQGESSNNAPKVTGNLTTVLEKYKNLAKDAASAGDYVTVENYLQHAEHFARVINERNLKNNSETRSSKPNGSITPEDTEKLDSEPVDIVKVLKPIPMDDTQEEVATETAPQAKKKTLKKAAATEK